MDRVPERMEPVRFALAFEPSSPRPLESGGAEVLPVRIETGSQNARALTRTRKRKRPKTGQPA